MIELSDDVELVTNHKKTKESETTKFTIRNKKDNIDTIIKFCETILFRLLKEINEKQSIITDAIIGFITNLLISNLILIFLFNVIKHIINDTICDISVEIIAPFILIIGISIIFKTNFIIAPIAKAITGVFIFPIPCRAPFIV